MTYSIKIFDRLLTNNLTSITSENFWDLSFSNEIGKGGTAEFKMQLRNEKANTTNLKLYNKIKIYKGGIFKWIGYIDNLSCDLNIITIRCSGMLNYLQKRNVSRSTTPGNSLYNEIVATLNSINSIDNTGIGIGTIDTTINITARIDLTDISGLQAFEKLANLQNRIIRINEDGNLDVLSALGIDKSSDVVFRYQIKQLPMANLLKYEVEIDGKEMANVIIGKAENLSVTKTDATSISQWGRLEHTENFGGTTGSSDLQNETQSYLDNHKQEVIIPTVEPNVLKIDIESFGIGDTVKVILDNGFIDLNHNYLITRIETRLNNSGLESINVSLTPVGKYFMPSNFFRSINKMDKRLKTIESIVL